MNQNQLSSFCLLMLLVAIPFDIVAVTVFNVSMSFSRNFGLLFFVCVLFDFGYHAFEFERTLWMPIVAAFIGVFHLFVAIVQLSDLAHTVTVSYVFNLLLFTSCYTYFRFHRQSAVYLLKLQGVVIGFISAGIVLLGYNSNLGRVRDGRLSFAEIDENTLASIAGVGVLGCVQVLIDKRNPLLYRVISSALCSFGMILIVNTGSRGGLLAVILGLSIVAVTSFVSVRNWSSLRHLVLPLIVVGVGYLVSTNEVFVKRLEDTLTDSGVLRFSGRDSIWQQTWGLLLESPVIGFGEIDGFEKLGRITRGHATTGTHNTFLYIAILSGIPAMALFCLFLIQPFRRIPLRIWLEESPEYVMYFVFFVAVFMSLDQLQARQFWIVLAYGFSLTSREISRQREPQTFLEA